MKQKQIFILDTTLRDGEQCPGATMTLNEKLKVAEALDVMGVDVIEAGFAASSRGVLEAIQEICKVVKNATVCSLARSIESDIDAACEAVKAANKGRVHLFVSTSPIHMKYKLKKKSHEVLDMIAASVSYARRFIDDVAFAAEDATRTEIDFLCRAVETAIANGASVINLPDTVGYITPLEYYDLIKNVMTRVPNSDKAIFSTHCHNDLGLATANSLAAINAGARQIECTVNGIGERAGNAALEEIVMAIKTRGDVFPFTTNINTTHITYASKLVSMVTGFRVQKNKAIVGVNAFAHESGIHQDGVLKNRETYEIMTPESVGINNSSIVLGKHSGRTALKNSLKKLSIELSDDRLNEVFENFKKLCDTKKNVTDNDLLALVLDEPALQKDNCFLISYILTNKPDGIKSATVVIKQNDKIIEKSAEEKGILNALFRAVNKVFNIDFEVEQYDVQAVSSGSDAIANASIILKNNGEMYSGSGRDMDTVNASIKAYLNAANKTIITM